MKIKCNQQSLMKSLNTVQKAITTRTTIPILKGILIETISDNQIRLAASDLDISIDRHCDAEVEQMGGIVVSSKLFADIIRKLPGGDIEIEEREGTVYIKCKSSEFTIVGQGTEEFPDFSQMEELDKFYINKETFKKMIRRTSFAASVDTSRGILMGVLIELSESHLTMVSLDGFRMAIARNEIHSDKSIKIVVEARILNEINKILAEEEEEEFLLVLDQKKIAIHIGNVKIISRLLEGDYMNYQDIIPKEKNIIVRAERRELLDAIERASLIVKDGKSNLIKLKIEENKIIITSRSEEGNLREEVLIEKQGEDLEIGFNCRYLSDILKAAEEDIVVMEFNNSITPCMVKPEEGNQFDYLILPVRISSN